MKKLVWGVKVLTIEVDLCLLMVKLLKSTNCGKTC